MSSYANLHLSSLQIQDTSRRVDCRQCRRRQRRYRSRVKRMALLMRLWRQAPALPPRSPDPEYFLVVLRSRWEVNWCHRIRNKFAGTTALFKKSYFEHSTLTSECEFTFVTYSTRSWLWKEQLFYSFDFGNGIVETLLSNYSSYCFVILICLCSCEIIC